MPKVSVIIPVYNIEKYLDKCLNSVVNQTLKDLEIICVNDGSTDNSLSIIEKYAQNDNRIKIINKINGGLSSAWNAGLDAATSEFITFVDGDDWIKKETFELAYQKMTQNDVDYVCWGANLVFEYQNESVKSELLQYYKINYIGKITVTDSVIDNTVVTTWSKLYKKSIIDEKEIRFPTKSGHDDNTFWLTYSVWAKNGYYIPKYLYNYVQRENSIMGTRFLKTTTKIFDNIDLIPPIVDYYRKNNLIEKHYGLLLSKIEYFFTEDYNFKNGIYKNVVLDKLSGDLSKIDLGALEKSKFIKAIINKDEKYLERMNNYSFWEKIFSLKNDKNHKVICVLGFKIKIKKRKQQKIDKTAKEISYDSYAIEQLRNSGLVDYLYYSRQCLDKDLDKLEILKHYLTIGWKENINPSSFFDGCGYLERYPDIKENPLLYFLNEGRYRYKDAFLNNKYPIKEEDILEYNDIKNSRETKKVVYTCITNDYDDLEEIKGYTYINPEWDYICFTDNQEYINRGYVGIWKIQPLVFNKLDGTRNNRWHKINPHLILKDYDESIYIDANINILTDRLFKVVDNNKKYKKMMFAEHASTMCLYKEFEWVLYHQVDKTEIMEAHLKLLNESGFPRNYGMPENNVIYRKHNDSAVVSVMEDWWYMLEHYTKRDQLSLPYVLWKHNIETSDVTCFPNTRINYKDFCTFVHKGKR